MPPYSIEAYTKLITDLGFNVLKFDYRWDGFAFPGRAQARDNFLGWLPQLSKIPQNLKEQFVDEFTDYFLKVSNQDPQGLIRLNFRQFVIEAQKV